MNYEASLSGMLRRADGTPAAFVPFESSKKCTTTDADDMSFIFDVPPGQPTVYAEIQRLSEGVIPTAG